MAVRLQFTSIQLMFLLLCSALLATTLQGVQGEVDVEGPSESECRPYIEKALKKLETGDAQSAEVQDDIAHIVTTDDSETQGDSLEITDAETSKSAEEETQEDDAKSVEEEIEQSKEQDASAETGDTQEVSAEEKDVTDEADGATEEVADESTEKVQDEASAEKDTQETQSEEKQDDTDEQTSVEEGTAEQASVEDTTAEPASKEEVDEGSVEQDGSVEDGTDQVQSAEEEGSVEQEGSQEQADEPKGEESAEQTAEESAEQDAAESAEQTAEESAEQTVEESAEQVEDSVEQKEESGEQKEESAEQKEESGEQKEESVEQVTDSAEQTAESVEQVAESAEQAAESAEQVAESAEQVAESAEQATESAEQAEGSVEQKEESTEQKEESAEEKEESGEQKEESAEKVEGEVSQEQDTSAEKQESVEQEEASAEVTEEKESVEKQESDEQTAEVESAEKAGSAEKDELSTETEAEKESAEQEQADDAASTEEATELESTPEEDLTWEIEIPTDLRPRDHVNEILHLNDETSETDNLLLKAADGTLKDLKRIYENAIQPLETLYKYRDLSNRHFGDPEIFSKPLVLFMGPWSGGKSSIINYLLDNEYTPNSLRTGAEPSPAYFNLLMWGEKPAVLDGTQLAADWTFSGLQKFGQGLEERLRGLKLPSKLLEKINIAEIPGILEVRKQVSRVFPFNDACQWFIDRADIIFLVYDPSKLDVGPETEAILDQLKGREYQTRIILNKADQVKPEELMRVQGALIWNISPLMSSAQPPVMYSTSLWSKPYEIGAPIRLLHAQERAFLRDLKTAIDKRIENKIASARRFAVRVRNHAKMVDCYLTTYYNHKSVFGNKKLVADQIIEHPQDYHIYEGLSTLTNISRYDLPDPDVYRDFFRLNPLYDFQQLSATCTYFRGCPINRLDISIAYDLPELVGKYKKTVETIEAGSNTDSSTKS